MASKLPLIGSAEACEILDIHGATLTRWVANGEITPAHKLPGRNGAFVFHRTDIEELQAKKARET